MMASSTVTEFTDANFDAEVLQATTPVLVDFWAEWCMPCKMLAPIIDELADQFDGKVKVGKLDTDSNRNALSQWRNGKEVRRCHAQGSVRHRTRSDRHLTLTIAF
jgi:thioredoxin-like negative regulator of GroEL